MAIALVHFPIVDGQKDVVATNITNFDIHDIARAATVYAVEKYYLIHPVQEQKVLKSLLYKKFLLSALVWHF